MKNVVAIVSIVFIVVVETAINIGYSSMLLTENMVEVFIVNGNDEETVIKQIEESQKKIANYSYKLPQRNGENTRVSYNGNSNSKRQNSMTMKLEAVSGNQA